MTPSSIPGMLHRTARLAVASAAILASIHGASADDAGIHQFFSAIFGGETQAAPSDRYAAAADGQPSRSRPLTVRLHRPKPRVVVADESPRKPGKVSIFEDRTLRRGDAVMTAKGIRVFAGSTSWPYAPGDFVALDDARQLSRDTTKVLAQLDRVPRG